MESKLNNHDILRYGDFNDHQVFFIQRWSELLNIHTHSKYAVRYLNTHQALKETLYVCKGMIEEEIKRTDAHLRLVFEEVNKIVESDKLFEKHAESHAKIMKNTLRAVPKTSETAKLYSIVYQLEYVIRHLKDNYLKWIVQDLKELLQQNEESDNSLLQIEKLLHILATELVGKGWALEALHSLVGEALLKRGEPVTERFEDLFEKLVSNKKRYVYLFSIKSGLTNETKEKLIQFKVDLLDGKELINTYSEYRLGNNVSENKYYIRLLGDSFDIQTGINTIWQEIAEHFDVLKFYGFELPSLDTSPIVLSTEKSEYARNIHVSLVAKKRKFRAPQSIMDKIQIQLSKGDNEINRKIKSLFEFSRISEESLSPQSTYLNLWIGIESFVQTKEYEGGIENVKMVVSSSSTHNYLYSLLKNFLEDCNRCNLQVSIGDQNIKVGKKTPQEAISLLLNQEYEGAIEGQCKMLNNLLAYRYKELRNVLTDGRESSRLLKNHNDNIKQHVQRLYRLRNSIVHSGKVHYNTNLFIKHLNEYLESTMSVVLHRLEESPNAKLEEIFAQVRDSVEATIETLGNSRNLDKDVYYDLVLRGAF